MLTVGWWGALFQVLGLLPKGFRTRFAAIEQTNASVGGISPDGRGPGPLPRALTSRKVPVVMNRCVSDGSSDQVFGRAS